MSFNASRRQAIASLSALVGCGVVSGCGGQGAVGFEARRATESASCPARPAWDYPLLEPAAVAATAYRIYPDGGCMYAVVGSVIGELAKQVGEPFRSFPVEMMRFGDGGVGGWGAMCGVVNGGAALIGLFHREKAKELRESTIAELCAWYETTLLPTFQPVTPEWADEATPSIAGSVLCHVSTSKWSKASGFEAVSTEKKERCRRLAADGAVKTVEILNRRARDPQCKFLGPTPEAKSCIGCHGPQELGDAMGKMKCAACHDFGKAKHPKP
ncbi:MAG: C-GCAxxG-C-C family (seleno)protein [Planctomycetota bacterium]